MYLQDVEWGGMDWSGSVLGHVGGASKRSTELSRLYKLLIVLLLSEELLTALEGLRIMVLDRCTVKWKNTCWRQYGGSPNDGGGGYETYAVIYTRLFISPYGISELDCATTKTGTAERIISIGRESLQVFCTRGLGVLPGSTARGSREEKWRSQWIR